MTTTSKPRRRWYQCSLRTLLVLMLLACIGMGWIAMKRQQARKEREAVEAIRQLDGLFGETVDLKGEPRRQASWRKKLLGDDVGVDYDLVVLTNDAAMAYLKDLTRLRTLVLYGRKVTDAGMKHLNGLTQLHGLDFEGPDWCPGWSGYSLTHVGDSGFAH